DAERWTVAFKDDFEGWQYVKFPFADFQRKDVGNGAPNDGLTLDEVHGWAFGAVSTDGPKTFYLDEVAVYGEAPERPLQVTFAASDYEVEEGATAGVAVKLTRPLKDDDPDQVSIAYTTDGGSAIVDRDYTPVAGTLTFVKGGASEQSFAIPTFDNNKHDGNKRVILRLSDPVDVELGFAAQASLTILDNDPIDYLLLDDFESYPYLWHAAADVGLAQLEIPAGDPLALPGQGAYEGALSVTAPLAVEIDIMPGGDGNLCNKGNGVIPVAILTTDSFDATTVDHTTVRFGDASEAHVYRKSSQVARHEEDVDRDGDIDLVFHFRFAETGFGCDASDAYLTGSTFDGQAISAGLDYSFGRDFALGQDWSFSDGLNFWYYGAGSGDTVTVQLKDNRAPDPGPSGWDLVWSDEFNDPAGTPPNPANWGYELGDGTINGIPGWGNDERQYYTDSTDNVATDGLGNLVITAREADGSYLCYYGPCEYTSARLLTKHKAEFAYGRIESRILVPDGDDGLWPAFWSLGTDIDEVDWPQTGEIDIMEYVSRLPEEIFGTIHGPGYSGGVSFGDTYQFPEGVANDYHTIAIEWQPDLINWYVDDILFHTATPADVAPNEWVFNDPIYLLLNMAVGGNFGGTVSDNTVFPQELTVDYVRVYQGPDTAERFQATFVDDFMGWQKVEIPFSAFTRSADQPAGAPDDGLGLNDVWGYGFQVQGTATGSLLLDQVRLDAPLAVTVTNNNDSGPGSLRQAIASVANGGAITFDPGLSGSTIGLTSGPLVISKDISVEGPAPDGLTVSGSGVHRVFIIDPGASAHLSHLTIADGYGWQLAGGILNNGQLLLDHVAVTGNTMATDGGDFWQGGGGIYNGGDSSLFLVDSTVAGNSSGWAGGGIYAYFGSATTVVRSTISGNTAQDVGGGLRTLSNANISNSTISGNTSIGWHGGGAFITDGVVSIINSTVTANSAPGGTAGGLFVGTFTDASATLNLQNSVVAANGDFSCVVVYGAGAVALNSLGNNVFGDATCNPIGSDQVVADAGLAALADNGGPTLTHALLATSPAVDAANGAACPAVDQRGVARPQGAGCDVGAYELVP
ncbi:MAG: family 16 glycosylhydrolase, partial [Chloroflexota bacterium]